MQLSIYNLAGEVVGEAEFADHVFAQPMNEGLVHQAIVQFQANQRVGTANTLTRAQVSGGGKKPWRQKGTGRARQGTSRAPHWRGGGVVFGPHPRDYRQLLPQKMRRLALRCGLSQRVREDGLRVIDELTMEQPQTKQAAALLGALRVEGGALIVTSELDRNVYLSARNIPRIKTTYAAQLNPFDVMAHPVVILSLQAARLLEQRLASKT